LTLLHEELQQEKRSRIWSREEERNSILMYSPPRGEGRGGGVKL